MTLVFTSGLLCLSHPENFSYFEKSIFKKMTNNEELWHSLSGQLSAHYVNVFPSASTGSFPVSALTWQLFGCIQGPVPEALPSV